MTSTMDFIEEQSQLDQIQRQQNALSRSLDTSNMHNSDTHMMMNQNTTSLVLSTDNQDQRSLITLNINTISSNLIYVATVLNHEYIKKMIKEVNLQGLMLDSFDMVDSQSDDFFLIYDLYKIYLFCVKHVIVETQSMGDGKVDPRQEQFMNTISDTFF